MTPLELFEAIGKMDPDSIQDSIQLYLADTLASEAEQDNKEVHKNPMPAKAAGIREQPPVERRYGIALLPYLLTAGCTAACIAGFGMIIRFSMGNEIVGTQSEIPISVQESVSSMTTAVSTGERAVLTAITETHTVQQTVTVTAEDRTEPVSVTETDAVTEPAAAMTAMQTENLLLTETAAAKTQTETLPLTETTAAETQTETTATEPPPLVYEMGDVDMDGQITFVDAALVYVDWYVAIFSGGSTNHWENPPLTEEQRKLGNVLAKSENEDVFSKEGFSHYFLSVEKIMNVAKLRNWYDIDVTMDSYNSKLHKAQMDREAFASKYGEEWSKSLEEAEQLLLEMNKSAYGEMTVEEFYEAAEVMKEKYFKNGWKEEVPNNW